MKVGGWYYIFLLAMPVQMFCAQVSDKFSDWSVIFPDCSNSMNDFKGCVRCELAVGNYRSECKKIWAKILLSSEKRLNDMREKQNFKPCVMIDLDHTAFDNWNQCGLIGVGTTISKMYAANPLILALCKDYFAPKGVKIFYVTARKLENDKAEDDDLYKITFENLRSQGFPLEDDKLICVPHVVWKNAPDVKSDPQGYLEFFAQWKLQQCKAIVQQGGFTMLMAIDDESFNIDALREGGIEEVLQFMPLDLYFCNHFGCFCRINKIEEKFKESRKRFFDQQKQAEMTEGGAVTPPSYLADHCVVH